MLRSLSLDQLGKRIAAVDYLLLRLVNFRMGLAVSVGARKRADNQEIYRREVENKRIDDYRIEGRKIGLNESFAEALMYLIIGESCKQQMIRLQQPQEPLHDADDDKWYDICKDNLRELTKIVAARYDQDYDAGFTASSAYRAYEEVAISDEVSKLQSKGLAVDLGCATGQQALQLARKFDSVVGFDLSEHMIEQANKNKAAGSVTNVRFEVADLDDLKKGIPLDAGSASFVLANFGVASDLRNIRSVIAEIDRVLEPGGRYFLSFYNEDALVYCWDYLPWPIGLAAEINKGRGCLDVHVGDKTYQIHARSYTPTQVTDMVAMGSLKSPPVRTFPTISSLLPSILLLQGDKRAENAITELDRELEDSGRGAYIIATGMKQ